MSADTIGAWLGVAGVIVLFGMYLGPALWDEFQTWWHDRYTPVSVCRGCGTPVPRPVVVDRDGIPFCTVQCAANHPNTYPEEYDPPC